MRHRDEVHARVWQKRLLGGISAENARILEQFEKEFADLDNMASILYKDA